MYDESSCGEAFPPFPPNFGAYQVLCSATSHIKGLRHSGPSRLRQQERLCKKQRMFVHPVYCFWFPSIREYQFIVGDT